jgi:hypothetical protein
VELAIAEFFGAGRYGDTLLAHFSCHGVKSPTGELYFATTDTDLSDTFKLKVTGIPSALVRDAMEESRASLILCLVDCCYSGAFVKLAKAADTVDLTERLGGKGRAVITASTSLQLALDGEEEPSLFTHAVIDGLRTGEADRDLDGLVSLDELYNYVHDRVTSLNPHQTPVKSFDVEGEVYVARRSTPVTRPAALEPDLLSDAHSPVTYKRLGAVQGLANVLDEDHPGRSLAARTELARLAGGDDSLKVRSQAQAVLDAAGELPAPAIPDYEPTSITRGPLPQGAAPAPDVPGTAPGTGSDADTTDDTTDATAGAAPGATGGSRGTRGRRRPSALRRGVLVALGLVTALSVAALTWRAAHDDSGPGGGETVPVLPDTELLVAADDPQLGRGIFALDVETGATRVVIPDPEARFPTISQDRQWVVYLVAGDKATGGVPRMARVDGSDDARLLDPEATEECPTTTRPAFTSDGGRLAAMCVDANGEHVALAIIDRDGHLLDLVEQGGFLGAPTWTGDGRIVVMRDVEGDGTTALWVMSADGEDQRPVTDGLDGSDSHPDWSDRGLLFLRDRNDSSNVVHLDSVDSPRITPITSTGRAQSPTWGPGDDPAVVWLEPAAEGSGLTLWGKALDESSATQLGTGVLGAPAWGSR